MRAGLGVTLRRRRVALRRSFGHFGNGEDASKRAGPAAQCAAPRQPQRVTARVGLI
jgi:hypothetical protein